MKKEKLNEKKMFQNISPLRYPGGKTRACTLLNEVLEQNFNMRDMGVLVSPFFGGGSFEFYVQNKYGISIIANDKFTPLHSFWICAKNQNRELCQKLRDTSDINKKQFLEYRGKIMNLKNPLTQGIHYFIINRCSFSGSTLSGGFSLESSKKRFTHSSIDRIEKLDLSNIEFYNEDFVDFFDRKFIRNCVIFLDPPYYLESKLYGEKGDLHTNFDHEKLFQIISKKKNWMMTYNDCLFIRQLYRNFKIIPIDWSYGMNKSKKSSEIVIICGERTAGIKRSFQTMLPT